MTTKTSGPDLSAPVPAFYAFEDQIADNIAAQDERDAQNPAPPPFAVSLEAITAEAATQAEAQAKTKGK